MNTFLVLTVIGEDRPGLVESLSETVAGHGGNWLESRMAHLAGRFAGILRVAVAEERADDLRAALAALQQRGLSVVVERGAAAAPAAAARLRLELLGADHPGIVRDVARALAERGINVEELDTESVSAPMSGEPLFRASAELHAPGDLSIDELRTKLEELAEDLMVDISLDSVFRAARRPGG